MLGDTITSLRSGYEAIAGKLGLPPATPENPDAAVNAVLEWLAAENDYLLVIDNVDAPNDVVDLLPLQATGHVLLTSRNPDLDLLGVHESIDVEDMPLTEAMHLLIKRGRRQGSKPLSNKERNSVQELAIELGCLPLVLEQAAAYIRVNRMAFGTYLDEYRKLQLKLLDEMPAGIGKDQKSVRTTWAKSIERVKAKSQAAVDLLNACAFLAPDKIPFEFVTEGYSKLGETIVAEFTKGTSEIVVLNRLLKALQEYSLIRRDEAKTTFDVHRMVQSVVRDTLSKEEHTKWLDRSLKALGAIWPGQGAMNWPLCGRLVGHWLASTDHAEGKELLSAALLFTHAGIYFDERASYLQSEKLKVYSLSIYERILGPNHPNVSMSLNNLALLYYALGRYLDALPLCKRALSIDEKIYGSDHPEVATDLNNLAGLYRALGCYSDALPLHECSLSIHERILGPNHPNVSMSLSNLALLYYALGRYRMRFLCVSVRFRLTRRFMGVIIQKSQQI